MRRALVVGLGAALLSLSGCSRDEGVDAAEAHPGGMGGGAGASSEKEEVPLALVGAPLVFTPTDSSFGVSAVVGSGEPKELALWRRVRGTESWRGPWAPASPAPDVAEWRLRGLEAGTEYEYVLAAASRSEGDGPPPHDDLLYAGRAVTQRASGEAFSFVLISDTHIDPREVSPGDWSASSYQEQVLLELAPQIAAEAPDFVVNLGDMLDFHVLGFNSPLPEPSWGRLGYVNYRRCLRDVIGHAAHFPVVGNWEGENGSFTAAEIANARGQRKLYVPAPNAETYPEGGSPDEDYYAFTWGDALFVVLNVMSYTEESLLLDGVGSPDAWTLGEAQLRWLEDTLEAATSKWRFLLIHHAVGGAAGNDANAIYGRGGGLAANVGEQALVHDLMVRHGVQVFFYGHDHVFTDMVVDEIHYTLPGSAGAPWKFTSAETGYEQYWPDSGYARVRVAPESVDVEFLSISGEVLHRYDLK